MSELLDHYFEGNLTEEKQAAFDELLLHDANFRKEFEFQKLVRAALTQKRQKELKKLVQGFEQTTTIPWYRTKAWVSIAASVLLLSGIGLFFYQSGSPAEHYFQPLPNMIAPVVRAQVNEVSPENTAFELYELEKYEEAIEAFKALPFQNYKDIYIGISYLALDEAEQALPYFQTEITSDSLSLNEYRKWYLALTHLQLDQSSKAKSILEELVEKKHPISEQAKSLLSDLR